MIVQRRAPWEAFHPVAELEFMPFRDAGRGPSDFNLNIQDCLWGTWKAMQNGLCDMNEFSVEDYEYYEKVENGDWNWITPNFIAFASPVDTNWIKREKEARESKSSLSGSLSGSQPTSSRDLALQRKLPTPFLNCLDYFEKRNIKLVVRLNTELYDRNTFLDRGIDHMELYFDDGTNPTDEIVRTFIEVADRVVESGGVVAVHVSDFTPQSTKRSSKFGSAKLVLAEQERSLVPISSGNTGLRQMRPLHSCASYDQGALLDHNSSICISSSWSGLSGLQ